MAVIVSKSGGEHYLMGGGLVLLGAVSFGMHSTLVKQLLYMGSNPFQVLFYEFVLAAILLGGIRFALGRTSIRLKAREVGRVLFWGVIGAAGTGICLYSAVGRIPVALAIVLLFYYVPWVFFLEFAVLKIRPSRNRWIALAMILAGTILATDVIGVTWSRLDVWGVVLGLLSGLCYGTFIFGARGLGTIATPLDRAFIICGAACGLLLAGGIFWPELMFLPPEGLARFAGLAVVVTVMGQVIPLLAFSKAIPIIGGSLAAIIASVELPMACLTALVVLGETLVASQWLGVFLISLAVVIANWRRSSPEGSSSPEAGPS